MPLLVLSLPSGETLTHSFTLEEKVVTLGRAEDNDVCVKDKNVSEHHAELRRTLGGYSIVDLRSENGTFANGKLIEWAKCTENAQIFLSSTTSLILEFSEGEIEFCEKERAAADASSFEGIPEAKALFEEEQSHKPTPRKLAGMASTTGQNRTLATGAKDQQISSRPLITQKSRSDNDDSSFNEFSFLLCLIILCIIAVFAGISLRYFEETGGIFLSDWLFPTPVIEAPAQLTPAS